MNEIACVVGIDVAKRKFDMALLTNNKIKTKVFDNTPTGHQAFAAWLHERGAPPEQAHLCMEATGGLTAKHSQSAWWKQAGVSAW